MNKIRGILFLFIIIWVAFIGIQAIVSDIIHGGTFGWHTTIYSPWQIRVKSFELLIYCSFFFFLIIIQIRKLIRDGKK